MFIQALGFDHILTHLPCFMLDLKLKQIPSSPLVYKVQSTRTIYKQACKKITDILKQMQE